nr:hypothetical protein [uncultured Desulfobulbus sp.]
MRHAFFLSLLLLLCPSFVLAGRGYGPPPPVYGYPAPYGGSHNHHARTHDHRDAWIPAAIVGGLLGIFALSQMDSMYTQQAPGERICRDTYNYYDAYGNYTHSTYVDRPCR